jgi:hypothetical protein
LSIFGHRDKVWPENRLYLKREIAMPRLTRVIPAFLLAVGAAAACAPATPDIVAETAMSAPAPQPGEPTLDEVRRATERFQDVQVALAEGYVRDPFDLCDTAAMMGRPAELGAMGIHYVRMDLVGVTGPPNPRVSGTGVHTDFLTPSVLIYEPQADGSLTLVAVENLAFEESWKAAGHTTPPSFHGVPYDYMADDPATEMDEAHMFEPHYDRHVWLFRDNPNGIFTPFNPNVTCANFKPAG